ncbi:protein kinase [Nocardioidaceae bacterium]|nr:protein kinase [Nocardioidaceae bacterium]
MDADDLDAALGANYRLERRAGSGAMGEVWVALDRRTDERVAAKLLRSEHTQDPALVARFVQERSILVGLRHPALVAVRDLVVEGDRIAIVMDHVDGGSLRDLLTESGPLTPADAVAAAVAVLQGLAAAHDADVLHRDVKPDNVLLSEPWREGRRHAAAAAGGVRLSDFGIARIVAERTTSHTGVLGTPEYLCPELIETEQCGPRGDVYAVGIMLYELLAGRTPFAGSGSAWAIAQRHVQRRPPRIPVDDDLWAVIERMLAKDPAARPTAADAAGDLESLRPRLLDAPALAVQGAPSDYETAAGPQTVVRPLARDSDSDDDDAAEEGLPEVAPVERIDLGDAESATMVRPLQRPAEEEPARRRRQPEEPQRSRVDKRLVALVAGGVALVAVATVGVLVLGGDDAPEGQQPGQPQTIVAGAGTASQVDTGLPTGLQVTRRATYDPESGVVDLTLTYTAETAPLQGPLLEVLPAAGGGEDACADVGAWTGADAVPNPASINDMQVDCGWEVQVEEISPDAPVEVTASIRLDGLAESEDPTALQTWLNTAAQRTTEAVTDPTFDSDAFAVQRVQGVEVVVAPDRVLTGSPLDITLFPVWPDEPGDEPLLVSPPSRGFSLDENAASTLTAIAGEEPRVRFSSNCGSALVPERDGLVVNAIQQSDSPTCTVGVDVGNFRFLESNPVTVTGRGS